MTNLFFVAYASDGATLKKEAGTDASFETLEAAKDFAKSIDAGQEIYIEEIDENGVQIEQYFI